MTIPVADARPASEPTRNIVVPGEYWHGATAAGLAQSLRDIGHDVADIDLFDYFIMANHPMLRALQRLMGRASVRAYNQTIVETARITAASVMIACKGAYIDIPTLRMLRDSDVLRVNYFPDFQFSHGGFDESIFAHYDLVATTKSFQVDYLTQMLGAEKVVFVHHGYSPLVHRRRHSDAREDGFDWDISYIGSASPSKLAWLNAVAKAFPDRKLIVAGNGWTRIARGTPLAPFILGHGVTGDYYARMIERTRINLALHFERADDKGWNDRVSTRTFEIPACGGFMLHVDNEEVRGLYDVPGEIDCFATTSELCDKIGHYLARPDDRAAMIERAHARCVPAYGLPARAREIMAAVERLG